MTRGILLKTRLAAVLALAGTLLVGCGYNPHSHGGTFIAEHKPGEPSHIGTAPYSDIYVLFAWQPTTMPSTQPSDPPMTGSRQRDGSFLMAQHWVSKGDRIGFLNHGDDNVTAVAGIYQITLKDGRYCWHLTRMNNFKVFLSAVQDGFLMVLGMTVWVGMMYVDAKLSADQDNCR